jgi:hypothetical protein
MAVHWLELIRIRKVPGSNLGQETGDPHDVPCFSSVFRAKFKRRDRTLN